MNLIKTNEQQGIVSELHLHKSIYHHKFLKGHCLIAHIIYRTCVCVCVCVSIQAITFECLDIET